MNKGFFIRASIILGIFLAIILAAVGCEFYFNKDELMSNITNGEDAYLTIDPSITITNQDVWDGMKTVEGISYLEEYVDRMLLASYIAQVDQAMIDEEILYLKYYTTDPDTIAEIQEDEELHQRYLDSFEQNVKLLGYDPEDNDSMKELLELGIAKRLYAEEQILAETDSDSVYYIDESDLQDLYNSQNRGTACTIDLRFGSATDAENVFQSLNLYAGYTDDHQNNGIGLYDPSLNLDDENNPIPIGDVTDPTDFKDENTTLLTTEEVFTYYVKMWNILNPWEDQLDENVSMEDFCTTYPHAVKDYTEMTDGKSSSDPYVSYATKIFITMDITDTDDKPYSFVYSGTFGEFLVMTFLVEQDAKPDYDNATEQEIADLRLEVAEGMATDTVINNLLVELRQASDLTIFDPQFKLQMEFQADSASTTPDYDFSKDGSKVFLATFKNGETTEEVTPDELYAFMEERLGLSYAIDLIKAEYLIQSTYYTEMFGESRNVLTSDNENIIALRDVELLSIQNNFLNNQYVGIGYDNAKLDLDEFFYIAFGEDNIEDILRYIYIPSDLANDFIFDNIEYTPAIPVMEDIKDSHISLNVDHLLFYVDMEFDLSLDDFSDFYDGLSEVEQTEFDDLKSQLTADVNDYLAIEGNDFDSLVDEYKNTLITDETSTWQPYKAYGLFVQTQALGEVNQGNIDNYDEDFGNELVRIYGLYTEVVDDIDSFLGERLIKSDFGVHMVEATEGTYFEMPTAEFDYDDVDEEEGTYADGAENDSVLPSLEQVQAYIAIQAGEEAKQLPDSVEAAIEFYYGDVYEAYISGNGYNVIMMELILDSNPVFNGTRDQAFLEEQLAIYIELTFPELFDSVTE